MKNIKTKNYMMGILYYIIGIVGFFSLYIVGGVFDLIASFSKPLFNVCYAVVPLIILLLPLFVRKISRKEFYQSILLSCIAIPVYFILLFIVRAGVERYLSDFTTEKWNTYIGQRYLMIEDLEQEHDFVNATQEEVFAILGKEACYIEDDSTICYFVESEWLDSCYYCLDLDENNTVVGTRLQYID